METSLLYNRNQVIWDGLNISGRFFPISNSAHFLHLPMFFKARKFAKNWAIKSKGGKKLRPYIKKSGAPWGHRQFFHWAFKEVTLIYEYYKLHQSLLVFIWLNSLWNTFLSTISFTFVIWQYTSSEKSTEKKLLFPYVY